MNLNPAAGVACGINLNYTFVGAVMQSLGYTTHALGKWHLGEQKYSAL
jgi:arylsulfatase A-like enzyme